MFLEKLKILKLVHLNPEIKTFGNESIKATTMQEVNFLIKTTDQKLID